MFATGLSSALQSTDNELYYVYGLGKAEGGRSGACWGEAFFWEPVREGGREGGRKV